MALFKGVRRPAAIILLLATSSSAAVIRYDSQAAFDADYPTDRTLMPLVQGAADLPNYANWYGLNLTVADGEAVGFSSASISAFDGFDGQMLMFRYYTQPYAWTFDNGVKAFGMHVFDDGTGYAQPFEVRVYEESNPVPFIVQVPPLPLGVRGPISSDPTSGFIGFGSTAQIVKIEFTKYANGISDPFEIDNMVFAMPEPGSLLLISLSGLTLLRRRRR